MYEEYMAKLEILENDVELFSDICDPEDRERLRKRASALTNRPRPETKEQLDQFSLEVMALSKDWAEAADLNRLKQFADDLEPDVD